MSITWPRRPICLLSLVPWPDHEPPPRVPPHYDLLSPPYSFGGDGIYVYRLAHALAEAGHQVDVIHCALDRLADVFGLSVDAPGAIRSAHDSELGSDHHLAVPPANRAADQFLNLVGTIHVRRVQVIHAEIERAMNRRDRFLVVARTVEFRHPHASESDRRNTKLTSTKLPIVHWVPLK